MARHEKNNPTNNSRNLLVPGIDTYFRDQIEIPLSEWFEFENRKDYLPEMLRKDQFLHEVDKLEMPLKKYLFHINNNLGQTRVTKDVVNGCKVCNGPLCKGRRRKETNFGNSYCKQCKKYLDLYGIHKIFNKVDLHSRTREKNNRHKKEFVGVGEVSEFIRLEVFCKLWEGNYSCAITGADLDDFTGLFLRDRPKKLNEVKQGGKRWNSHWSIDRIDHRKGYVFENIQIVTREINGIKGSIEKLYTSQKVEATSQYEWKLAKIFEQVTLIYR
ncbi:hypothetical protein [Sporosarcina koreensis]|uniref:Uncharacterized protein n=1 Tax=Sporosarcina koreensis TaxID=334735 RepID=A0ABW0TTY4_9BACL